MCHALSYLSALIISILMPIMLGIWMINPQASSYVIIPMAQVVVLLSVSSMFFAWVHTVHQGDRMRTRTHVLPTPMSVGYAVTVIGDGGAFTSAPIPTLLEAMTVVNYNRTQGYIATWALVKS